LQFPEACRRPCTFSFGSAATMAPYSPTARSCISRRAARSRWLVDQPEQNPAEVPATAGRHRSGCRPRQSAPLLSGRQLCRKGKSPFALCSALSPFRARANTAVAATQRTAKPANRAVDRAHRPGAAVAGWASLVSLGLTCSRTSCRHPRNRPPASAQGRRPAGR
jgi:hypothetical protein